MSRSGVKTNSYKYSSKKYQAARTAVGRAAALLRARGSTYATSDSMSSPISRGGFGRKMPYYRQPELKCVDTQLGTGSLYGPAFEFYLAPTNTFTVLNVPEVGAAFYNRIGNEIEMKSLHLVGTINSPPEAATNSEAVYCRAMVLYDKQPNGAYPSYSDVIASYSNTGAVDSGAFDHLNPNNMDRFKILADIRVSIPNNDGGVATFPADAAIIDYTKNEVNINRFIKLNGMSTKYKASAGTIGDVTSGALLFFLIGTDDDATGHRFYFSGTARLRYVD